MLLLFHLNDKQVPACGMKRGWDIMEHCHQFAATYDPASYYLSLWYCYQCFRVRRKNPSNILHQQSQHRRNNTIEFNLWILMLCRKYNFLWLWCFLPMLSCMMARYKQENIRNSPQRKNTPSITQSINKIFW